MFALLRAPTKLDNFVNIVLIIFKANFLRANIDEIATSNRSVTLALITIFCYRAGNILSFPLFTILVDKVANKYTFGILIYPCILGNELLVEQLMINFIDWKLIINLIFFDVFSFFASVSVGTVIYCTYVVVVTARTALIGHTIIKSFTLASTYVIYCNL